MRQKFKNCCSANLMSAFLFLFVLRSYPSLCQMSYTHLSWHASSNEEQVDRWTISRTGCSCPHSSEDKSCPCCGQGGCPCGQGGRCVQCGLEQGCGYSKHYWSYRIKRLFIDTFAKVCNMTISAEDIARRSGLSAGEIKSSPGMKGPLFCWFR